jgi:phage tail sheath protein FI
LILAGESDTALNTALVGMVGQGETERNDAMVFMSPTYANAVTTPSASAIVTGKGTTSNYAVVDSAWKYQYDRYRDKFIYVPMNGDVAGLVARTEFTNDAWWSPAGMTRGSIKNIVKLSWEQSKVDRDTLYKGSVNPFITMSGTGVLLWGDKTAQVKPSAFDRINVRRWFIVMEKAISAAAKSMLFEFNDEFTRAQFVNMVEPFLREIQGRRGITDFKVVCDGSNNSGVVIDNNEFVGDIYVKPTRSINYIQLNFIAARTDVNFTEIGG